MTRQERFEAMQARWRKAHEAERTYAHQLEYKYGRTWSAPIRKRDRHDALRRREDSASDAIFAWLDDNSPRNWRTGAPCYWICDSLTYADATTAGQLSVTPPVAYGRYPMDSLRFAAPVSDRETVSA